MVDRRAAGQYRTRFSWPAVVSEGADTRVDRVLGRAELVVRTGPFAAVGIADQVVAAGDALAEAGTANDVISVKCGVQSYKVVGQGRGRTVVKSAAVGCGIARDGGVDQSCRRRFCLLKVLVFRLTGIIE